MNKILSTGLLIAFLIVASSFSTTPRPQRFYSKADFQLKLNQLRAQLGASKVMIPELELAALIALQHFPELKETAIQFKYRNIKTTMATRPTLSSMLGKKAKRTYVIYVDNSIKNNNGILANAVPFNALVGLIGHEYQHILAYEEMSAFQIAHLGLQYCGKKFKQKFECETDHAIIDRGLGWQLRDWAAYAMVHSFASDQYKRYKMDNYLSPNEISRLIRSNKRYQRKLDKRVNEDLLAVD